MALVTLLFCAARLAGGTATLPQTAGRGREETALGADLVYCMSVQYSTRTVTTADGFVAFIASGGCTPAWVRRSGWRITQHGFARTKSSGSCRIGSPAGARSWSEVRRVMVDVESAWYGRG